MKKLLNFMPLAIALIICLTACGENSGSNTTVTRDKDTQPVVETEAPIVTYTVTFDYNDGSGRKQTVNIPKGESIARYAPYPAVENREVISWSATPDGTVKYTGEVTAPLTLYATWQSYEVVVYDENFPETVNDRFVEIRPEVSCLALSGKVLKIGPSVKKISLISDGTIYDQFSVLINNRSEDVYIVLDNFCYSSMNTFGLKGESTSVDYTAYIEVNGMATIDCSKSVNAGSKGVDCVSVPNLDISGTGRFLLLAGKGADGESMPQAGDGRDGEHGGNGQSGGNGIVTGKLRVSDVTLKIVAGDGGNGGKGGKGNNKSGISLSGKNTNGGNGGYGGSGGNTVSAKSVYINGATVDLTAGAGGNGGAGGECGGSSATFAGNGGYGGNGGNGGSVFNITEAYEELNAVKAYTPGKGGQAGAGGKSALSSLDGKAGISGADGSVGIS